MNCTERNMPNNQTHTEPLLAQLGAGNHQTHYYNHTHGRRLTEQTVTNHESAIVRGVVDPNSGTQTSLRTERFIAMGTYQ